MLFNFLKLSNNFNIIHIENKESEIISISLLGKAGSTFESLPGTAHFLEHVALNGTKKYPNKKNLDYVVGKHGGWRGGTTGKEFVEYVVKIIQSEAESGFDYLSQIAFYPLIEGDVVDKERKIILQEHSRALSNNQRQLLETMLNSSFDSKTMNNMVLGNESSINKITTNDLKNFWNEHYVVNNFVLCVNGNIDKQKAQELGEKYFGQLPIKSGEASFPEHKENQMNSVQILKREDINQARFMLSYPSPKFPSKDFYIAQLLTFILGKDPLSKLNQALREKNQLAYDTSARMLNGYGYSLFCIETGISENKINDAIKLISKELKEIGSSTLPAEELAMFKLRYKSNLLFGFENSLNVASYHAKHFYISSDLTSYKKELEIIEAISTEEIKQVAKKMFSEKPHLSVLAKHTKEQDIDIKPLL